MIYFFLSTFIFLALSCVVAVQLTLNDVSVDEGLKADGLKALVEKKATGDLICMRVDKKEVGVRFDNSETICKNMKQQVPSNDGSSTKNILIVCTANTCRSAMAHYYLQHLIDENHLKFKVASCGTKTETPAPINEKAEASLKKFVPNISGKCEKHLSQKISQKLVDEADYIFCMTSTHEAAAKEYNPKHLQKFGDFGGHGQDVKDPHGEDLETYEKSCEELIDLTNAFVQSLSDESAPAQVALVAPADPSCPSSADVN